MEVLLVPTSSASAIIYSGCIRLQSLFVRQLENTTIKRSDTVVLDVLGESVRLHVRSVHLDDGGEISDRVTVSPALRVRLWYQISRDNHINTISNTAFVGETKELFQTLLECSNAALRASGPLSRTVLLHGAAGSGKSAAVREVAHQLGGESFLVDGGALLTSACAPQLLSDIFALVSVRSGALLVLEDLDILSCTVGDAQPPLSVLLHGLLDSLLRSGHICAVVGVVRDIDRIPIALRNLFDRRLEWPIGGVAQRKSVSRALLFPLANAGLISPDSLPCLSDQLAQATAGYLAADLRRVVRRAGLIASSAGRVIGFSDIVTSLRQVRPSQLADFESDSLPAVTWEQVGGCGEVRRYFEELLSWPVQYQETMQRLNLTPPSGLLLYGPSGCGKTLCVNAFARCSGMNTIYVKASEVFSKYLGEAEKQIRRIFQRARKAAPCIVFIDEIDAVGGKRGGGESEMGVRERVLTQILTELDGVQARLNVFVIGCTNRPDLMDEAMLRPGRLDTLLYLPPPSELDRIDIINVRLRTSGAELSSTVNRQALAVSVSHFSGADLASLCREALLEAVSEWRRTPPPAISPSLVSVQMHHFDTVINSGRVRASLSPTTLELYTRFRSNHTK